MAFMFSKETACSTVGTSGSWKRRVKSGIAMALVAGMAITAPGQNAQAMTNSMPQAMPTQSVAEPTTQFQAAHEAAVRIAETILDSDKNAFEADTLNASKDASIREAEKSTVLIVRYINGDYDDQIDVGSGTVIHDSENASGFNGILTAGHVVGREFGNAASADDPCADEDTVCAAFTESGRPLGRLHLRAGVEDMRKPATSVYQAVRNDAVVMDIDPYDPAAYARIPGVKLASTIPDNVVTAHTGKEYHSGDGTTFTVGASKGMSGGGVYSKDGLIGVVSTNLNVHMTKNHDVGFYLDTIGSPERSSIRGNANLLAVINALPDVDKVTGIPRSAFQAMQDTLDRSSSMPENYSMVAPVTSVVHALGMAPGGSHVGKIENADLTFVGNPLGQAMTIETTSIVNPFEKSFTGKIEDVSIKARIVDAQDQNPEKSKPSYMNISSVM